MTLSPPRVELRPVEESDLPILYAHQADEEATRMAAFPSRDRESFMAHWARILADESKVIRTIVCGGSVVGNILSWEASGDRLVGYWIGREHWGKGIATAALSRFVEELDTRPLIAHVAKHNLASLRVLRKCGFTILREDRFRFRDDDCEEYLLILGETGSPTDPPSLIG